MMVNGLIDTNSAQTVESVQFDVGGKNVHGVIAIRDWDEEVKHVSFIFLISLWHLPSSLPFRVPLVGVFCPVFVGFFQASHVCLAFCQIITPLLEYLNLFLVVMADFLILSCNSSQSLRNEEELLPAWCPVSFESSTH